MVTKVSRPMARRLTPKEAYSTMQWARVRVLSPAWVIMRIPYQSPLAGVEEEEVKVMGRACVPRATRDPSTMSSVREVFFPPV